MVTVIPSQLGRLTVIKAIHFGGDDDDFSGLTSTVPTEFGLLTIATELTMAHNSMVGSIPSELGCMTALEKGASYLKSMFEENLLTGKLPTEIGKLTAFTEWFRFSQNQFTGSIPSELGGLTALASDLGMHTNRLSGTVPTELGRLSALVQNLRLHSNKLSGTIPTEIGALTAVSQGLYFSKNEFTGTLPTQLGRLAILLSNFNMHNTANTGRMPTQLGRFTGLVNNFGVNANDLRGSLVSSERTLLSDPKPQPQNLNPQTPTIPTTPNIRHRRPPAAHFPPPNARRPQPILTSPLSTPRPTPSPQPTELGNMVAMTGNYQLGNNQLCGDIPTQVAALSAANYANDEDGLWKIKTNNDVGSECPAPTPMPSLEPSQSPTATPTLLPTTPSPTPQCTKGQELVVELMDDGTWSDYCVDCTAGKYSNSSGSCVTCRAGTYAGEAAAIECSNCPEGQMSSSDGTSCGSCPAGTFVFNDTACNSCTQGKYAPSAQTDDCLECGEGYYTGETSGSTYWYVRVALCMTRARRGRPTIRPNRSLSYSFGRPLNLLILPRPTLPQ